MHQLAEKIRRLYSTGQVDTSGSSCSLPDGTYCVSGWHVTERNGVRIAIGRCGQRQTDPDLPLSASHTFENFAMDQEPDMYRAVREWLEGDGNLVLSKQVSSHSSTGTGKTHLLLASYGQLTEEGSWAIYVDAPKLSEVVQGKSSWNPGEAKAEITKWKRCDVLILDHLGMETTLGPPTSSVLVEVLNGRSGRHAVASDYSREELQNRYGQPLVSRLYHRALVPEIVGEDYRKNGQA